MTNRYNTPDLIVEAKTYMLWEEYESFCVENGKENAFIMFFILFTCCHPFVLLIGVPKKDIKDISHILHDTGVIVWQNAPVVDEVVSTCIFVFKFFFG